MKGLEFIPIGPVSEEAKAKLNRLMEKRKVTLERMVQEVRDGKFDEIIKSL